MNAYAEALDASDLKGPSKMHGLLSELQNERPIQIYTLGRFAVLKDAAPLSLNAKPQRKPMSLLKAVLALGGTEVSCRELIDTLWPEAEGDTARNAFDVTLHRLRKLIKRNDAIHLGDGKLSLDPHICWVDASALERVFKQLETAVRDFRGEAPLVEALVERMLELYRGPFLNGESEPWMLAARERLRIKFHRHGSMAGQWLERVGRFDQAAEIYQRALELDPLAEEFSRGLMLCRKQSGRNAEALDVYRRCREILSITLGVQPSAGTQAVYRSLLRQTP
jgi:DNA-binding SARP family transcriptional activator